jgi:hypothetical protein
MFFARVARLGAFCEAAFAIVDSCRVANALARTTPNAPFVFEGASDKMASRLNPTAAALGG